ncbi:hypothetical protein PVK06_016714 [Gossypium arboreum]|uniref:Uncharacterized protein n=1 Tax=Gossypium arboreum TaxID=29729 RepID=A0ABR0Q178_GOSAR|nr:hypothetical protein PVK06_016714 [Gossypium arboreum]
MGGSVSCSICGTTEESILRVLRDYCKSCEVCKQIILVGVWPLNFSTSLFEWVTANLRNDFERAFQYANILQSLWRWARSNVHRSVASVGNSARNTQNREWRPLLSEYIKVNIDGARNPGLRLASATTVMRNGHNTWLGGVGRNIGKYNIEQVELWAI